MINPSKEQEEEWVKAKHEGLVKHVAKMQSLEKRRGFIKDLQKKQGKEYVDQFKKDLLEYWNKNNNSR